MDDREEPVTVSGVVDAAWERITTWLQSHTPVTAATLRPPAPADDIHAVQDTAGRPFPDDLLVWWRLMDGVDDEADYRTAFTLPGVYMPLSVARVREEWASLSAYPDQDCCRPDGHHRRAAGDATFGYCTALLPVCRAVDGAVLALDLRPGPDHGCVMDWMAQASAHHTSWTSIGGMLTDTAERLDRHTTPTTPPRPGEPTVRDDGALTWT
ncbi:SMI1/KNR4 family protein [Amycolatopsis sp. EV170708-02-1]|uniref:SMI1/KNR4 family protein n=1 Tax=Amycolatopsis sp. EV170708-02-1 TaxID=2919322 RepID=UPI001F0BDF16|nr:SMI1/KNR4 family protein [Amycolatopsis sp. EV170708-02-1]UMP00087.1 SMI1/KNR4 family protein [Amycolatopsis sp. EV170708-02-1]